MKEWRVGILAMVCLGLFGMPLSAQQGGAAPKVSGREQSLIDLDRETLSFGIDSQVLDLLKTLSGQPIAALNPDVKRLFEQSANPEVQIAALDYLRSVRDWTAQKGAIDLLRQYQQGGNLGERIVVSAVRYLRDSKDGAANPLFVKLTDDPNSAIAQAAIDALGKSGDHSYAPKLIADLLSSDFPSGLKPDLLLALGELRAEDAVAPLITIAKNPDEQTTMREYACYALGRIGNPDSLPTIIEVYRSKNDYLRAYAVSALSGFSGPRVDSLLIEALKDDFWRVRENAAQSLGKRKVAQAVPILEYKAKYDPTANVRLAAVTALGKIGGMGAIGYLRTLFANDNVDPSLRETALDSLVASDLAGSIATIQKVISSLWARQPDSPFLDFVCKQLSEAKSPILQSIFLKFLDGPTLNIKIYGIRGIMNNGFTGLRSSIVPLSTDKNAQAVRETALSALQTLK